MNAAIQLGSYIRYSLMGKNTKDLALQSGLSNDAISKATSYAPDLSADTLLRLTAALKITLYDLLRTANINTLFARKYDSAGDPDRFVFKVDHLREFVRTASSTGLKLDGHGVLAQTPLQDVVKTALGNQNKQSRIPGYSQNLTPTELELDHCLGRAFGRSDVRDLVLHLADACPRGNGETRITAFSQAMSVPEKTILNLCGAEPIESFSDVFQIDRNLKLEGLLITICWKASENQLGIFTGSTDRSLPITGWTAEEQRYAEYILECSRLIRKEMPTNLDWYSYLTNSLPAFIEVIEPNPIR